VVQALRTGLTPESGYRYQHEPCRPEPNQHTVHWQPPAISPPTHPPNFLEESLRALFHRRPGFKRMSFRQKINGPMCFVEFEDIPFATQAMRELYGNTLNGLVKGGIRLSYSKNSLGQRGNSHQQGVSTSMFGGIAHTVALAGMSSGPSGNQMAPGAPGGGFLGPSPPVPIGSSSSTATTPGADPADPVKGRHCPPQPSLSTHRSPTVRLVLNDTMVVSDQLALEAARHRPIFPAVTSKKQLPRPSTRLHRHPPRRWLLARLVSDPDASLAGLGLVLEWWWRLWRHLWRVEAFGMPPHGCRL
jgi:hypothetical protein